MGEEIWQTWQIKKLFSRYKGRYHHENNLQVNEKVLQEYSEREN